MGDRHRLAERQAELVRALWGDAEPLHFDPVQLRRSAVSLQRKRERTVARAWPALAASLNQDYPELFARYSRTQPLPEGGPMVDGRLFARYLDEHGRLPLQAAREVVSFDLTWRLHPDGTRSRRRFGFILRSLAGRRVLGLRLGERLWLR